MRKKGLLFFFLLIPVLCPSCKGRGLSVIGVEPRVVYVSGEEEGPGQYLFVFIRTEDCDEAKSVSLSCPDASLSWLSFSPYRGDDGVFYAVFLPDPSSPFPEGQYSLTLSDFYGGSSSYSFQLSYDEGMAVPGKSSDEALGRYAFFRKDGRLEIFTGMNENEEAMRADKRISGRRGCRLSEDGGTVVLMPYEEIN